VGSSVMSILIGYFLDLKWNGETMDGIKSYSLSEYKFAFLIFLIVSVIGILMSFMKDNKVKG